MIERLKRMLRKVAMGKSLARAFEQNDRAADTLDSLLREVLKR